MKSQYFKSLKPNNRGMYETWLTQAKDALRGSYPKFAPKAGHQDCPPLFCTAGVVQITRFVILRKVKFNRHRHQVCLSETNAQLFLSNKFPPTVEAVDRNIYSTASEQ